MPTSHVRQKALIRTLSLGQNYGGILQAYALQQVLNQLGHDVETDISVPRSAPRRLLRPAAQKLGLLKRPGTPPERITNEMSQELIGFVRRRISTTSVYRFGSSASKKVVDGYSAFVVGSDQVWRPRYADVRVNLFDFLPKGHPGLRLSYAASFGLGDAREFSNELITQTAPLAEKLAGISVREGSGQEIVRKIWGRSDAQHHIDPTLLLDADHYLNVSRQHNFEAYGAADTPSMVSYVLDATAPKVELVRSLTSELAIPEHSLLRPSPTSAAEYRRSPTRFKMIPIEAWLASIRDAKYVVTDSFHGSVFAIIFNVPFLVIPNAMRGADRFSSILDKLGLSKRMLAIDPSQASAQQTAELIESPIDWDDVESRLNVERSRGRGYLSSILGVD